MLATTARSAGSRRERARSHRHPRQQGRAADRRRPRPRADVLRLLRRQGMADASACGKIFAAPSPDIIYAATKAAHRGKGVLYVYGNYAGDNMNFDMAAEMRRGGRHRGAHGAVTDDVAAAPTSAAGPPRHRRARSTWSRSPAPPAPELRDARRGRGAVRARRRRQIRSHRRRGARPARFRRPASRPSNSATTRSRSAWARMASPASSGAS